MRVATAAFRAGKITEPDYRARTEAFWRHDGCRARRHPFRWRCRRGSDLLRSKRSLADRLASLARLHAEGILTDDEFGAAKRHLLER